MSTFFHLKVVCVITMDSVGMFKDQRKAELYFFPLYFSIIDCTSASVLTGFEVVMINNVLHVCRYRGRKLLCVKIEKYYTYFHR